MAYVFRRPWRQPPRRAIAPLSAPAAAAATSHPIARARVRWELFRPSVRQIRRRPSIFLTSRTVIPSLTIPTPLRVTYRTEDFWPPSEHDIWRRSRPPRAPPGLFAPFTSPLRQSAPPSRPRVKWEIHQPPRWIQRFQIARRLAFPFTSRTVVPSIVLRRARVKWERHQAPRWIQPPRHLFLPQGPLNVICVSVAAGVDDAEEADDGTGFTSGATGLTTVASTTASLRNNVGLRFAGISIPRGAIIQSASLSIDVVGPSDDMQADILAELIGDAPNFSTNPDVTSRTRTSASVDWSENVLGLGIAQSPDFAAVIQKVVNQSAWVSGNALVVFLDGQEEDTLISCVLAAYEHATGTPAKLCITYSLPRSIPHRRPRVQWERHQPPRWIIAPRKAFPFAAPTITLCVSVAAGNDDAHEAGDGTGFDRTATELKAYASTTSSIQFKAGMRFTGITIPAGSTIIAATIDIEITTSDDARVAIGCEDVDDAADFLTDPDVTSRASTSTTSWVQDNLGLGVVTSPDFASAVQEVIDRPGWVSGNALVVLMGGFASGSKQLDFAAFEHATAAPVQLCITYTAPAAATSILPSRPRVRWELHQPPRWSLAERQSKHTPLVTAPRTVIPSIVLRRERIKWERHQPPRWALAEKQSQHVPLLTAPRTVIPSLVIRRPRVKWEVFYEEYCRPHIIIHRDRRLGTLTSVLRPSVVLVRRRIPWELFQPPPFIIRIIRRITFTSRTIIPSVVLSRRRVKWERHQPPRWALAEEQSKHIPLLTAPRTIIPSIVLRRERIKWERHQPPRWILAESQSKHTPLPTVERAIIPSIIIRKPRVRWENHQPPRWALAEKQSIHALPFGVFCPRVRSSATAEITVVGTSLTITKPAGLSDGDTLFAFITLAASTDPPALAGWTVEASQSYAGGIGIILRKSIVDAASEPANYVFSWTGDSRAVGAIVAVIGADLHSPVAAAPAAATGASASVDPPDSGAVASSDYLAIAFGSQEGKHTSPSWTPPTGYTEETDQGITGTGSGAAWCGQSVAWAQLQNITSENPATFTSTIIDDFAAFTLLIRCQRQSLPHKHPRIRWEDYIPPRFIEYLAPVIKVSTLTSPAPPVLTLVIRRQRVRWELFNLEYRRPHIIIHRDRRLGTLTSSVRQSIILARRRTPWELHQPPPFIIRIVRRIAFTARTVIPSVVLRRPRVKWEIFLRENVRPHIIVPRIAFPFTSRTVIPSAVLKRLRARWENFQPARFISRRLSALATLTAPAVAPTTSLPTARSRVRWEQYQLERFQVRPRKVVLSLTPRVIVPSTVIKRRPAVTHLFRAPPSRIYYLASRNWIGSRRSARPCVNLVGSHTPIINKTGSHTPTITLEGRDDTC